jgi:hypothetical protein
LSTDNFTTENFRFKNDAAATLTTQKFNGIFKLTVTQRMLDLVPGPSCLPFAATLVTRRLGHRPKGMKTQRNQETQGFDIFSSLF